MSDNKTTARNDTLTFIQVICAISVVILHANGSFWTFSKTESYWFSANIIEHLFVFAVPIFFMITGITLIDYSDKYSTKDFFCKRINKAVIPYIIWSFIAMMYVLFTSKGNFNFSIYWVINKFITGEMLPIYWFFPNLFVVYLMMPLFASIEKSKKESILKYFLAIGLVFNIILPFIADIPEVEITWPFQIYVVLSYMFWAVIGYVIYNYPPTRLVKGLLYVASVLGFFMQTYGTYYLSMRDGEFNNFFTGYNKLPTIMYTPGVFLFLCSIGKKLMEIRLINRFICFLGKYTFAIYLIHYFFIDYLVNKRHMNWFSLKWRVGVVIPIIVASIAITWILRKIPFIKKIVP